MSDTITAIATPSGIGAISVVRVSGPDSKNILGKVWVSSSHPIAQFESHKLYYGSCNPPSPPLIKGGEGGIIIDNILAVWMKGPNSYTGEDIIEIYCHGGPIVTKKVLSALLDAGARLAEPGEFTKRAFLNGKMDLAQAEAVADLISATSERAARLAMDQLEGRLSDAVHQIEDEVKTALALTEAAIDFPEEDIGGGDIRLEAGIDGLGKLISTYEGGRLCRDGVRVVLVGRPNVGKSSIFNALVGSDRVIVHHEPGTTRDVIEETITLDGILFRLTDVAGLRDVKDGVERLGVEKARASVSKADVVIVVLDASTPLDDMDAAILDEVGDVRKIIVWNKIDCGLRPPASPERDSGSRWRAGIANCEFKINPQSAIRNSQSIKTSALTGEGIESLKSALLDAIRQSPIDLSDGVLITNLRHKTALCDAMDALRGARDSAAAGESPEFIASHLRGGLMHLGRITGGVTTEEILDEIFSRFCIGK